MPGFCLLTPLIDDSLIATNYAGPTYGQSTAPPLRSLLPGSAVSGSDQIKVSDSFILVLQRLR